MADTAQQLDQAIRLSMTRTRQSGYFTHVIPMSPEYASYAVPLPAIGVPARQSLLRQINRHPQAGLWRGAVGKLIHRITGITLELSGQRRVRWYYDLIMVNSDLGRGWVSFAEKLLSDYLVYDDGAVVEIIGRGEPDSYLEKEAITGLAVLDPLRCRFTNDPDFPVWYRSDDGELHKIHFTRVHRFVDQAQSDVKLRGSGESALSRAMSFIQQEITNRTYVGQMLSDDLPPGAMVINGVGAGQWETKKKEYDAQKSSEKRGNVDVYSPVIEVIGDPEKDANIAFVPFARSPEGYDPKETTELNARGIALGLDIDPNDVLPIPSGSFGDGEKSRILDRKNREGGQTHLMKMLKTFLNVRILPDAISVDFQYNDQEQSEVDAVVTGMHMANANSFLSMAIQGGAAPELALEVAVRLLIENIPQLRGVLIDDQGDIIQLYDDDPEPISDQPEQFASEDGEEDQPSADQETETAETDDAMKAGRKSFEDHREDFEKEFSAILIESNKEAINRRRSGTLLRSTVNKYGRRLMIDGLSQGGVIVETLEGEDKQTFDQWSKRQSNYISNLTATIYDQGLSDLQIKARVQMWANKSMQEIFSYGIISGDRNGMYEVTGEDGLESCKTCQRIKPQVHRYKDWYNRRMRPGIDTENYDCGGFHCNHRLVKSSKKASGRF
jgi:hypothetical protein